MTKGAVVSASTNTPNEEPPRGICLKRCTSLVLVSDTPKGRGVFTTVPIKKGVIVEICPVLVISGKEVDTYTKHTELNDYTYNWPVRSTSGLQESCQAIVFGLGSMFNHSRLRQNVGWERDVDQKMITYRALQDIEAGEELCISYGDRLTFIDAEAISEKATDDEKEDNLIDSIQLGL